MEYNNRAKKSLKTIQYYWLMYVKTKDHENLLQCSNKNFANLSPQRFKYPIKKRIGN